MVRPTGHFQPLYLSQLLKQVFRGAFTRNGASQIDGKIFHCLRSGIRFTLECGEEMHVESSPRTQHQHGLVVVDMLHQHISLITELCRIYIDINHSIQQCLEKVRFPRPIGHIGLGWTREMEV